MLITAAQLRALAPSAAPAIIDGIAAGQAVLGPAGITTPIRIRHFFAQVAHESAGLRTTVEYASGKRYEGRADLGNTQAGDGVRFKGRGLLQLTGRTNYRHYGVLLGLPLERRPELAAEPATSLAIACAYWGSRNINARADRDDLEAVTRAINGGLNGLEDRRNYLRRARAIWPDAVPATARPTLRRGEEGEAVEELQRLLDVTADGNFGPVTEMAVIALQRARGLIADGIVGPRTWAALTAA